MLFAFCSKQHGRKCKRKPPDVVMIDLALRALCVRKITSANFETLKTPYCNADSAGKSS